MNWQVWMEVGMGEKNTDFFFNVAVYVQRCHEIVRYLTLRLLMSYIYIYGAPVLDVSRSHNDAAQLVGLLWTSDQLVAETST